MLNLASLISASIWRPEESDYQRFSIKLGSNLITVRGVVLNLTVICQRCNINLTELVCNMSNFEAVSYTHLTLPTIYSV